MEPAGGKFDRPKLSGSMAAWEIIFEVVIVIGLLLNFLIIAYGIFSIPGTVSPGIQVLGSDNSPNKWQYILSIALVSILPNSIQFVIFSIINSHPDEFNYPFKITVDNAQEIYRATQNMIRGVKLMLAWSFAAIAWWYTFSLPNPNAYGNFMPLWLLPVVFSFIIILFFGYKLVLVSKDIK